MYSLSLTRITFCLFFFLIPFLSVGKKTVGRPVKDIRIPVLSDTAHVTKKHTGTETKDGKGKIIKTVPKSRKQVKPGTIPQVIKIKPVKPDVKTKTNVPVKIKVNI